MKKLILILHLLLYVLCLQSIAVGYIFILQNCDVHTSAVRSSSLSDILHELIWPDTRTIDVSIHMSYSSSQTRHYVFEQFDVLLRTRKKFFSVFIGVHMVHRMRSYHNLWVIDGYRGFNAAFKKLRNYTIDDAGTFVIVILHHPDGAYSESEIMERALRDMFEINIINVTILWWMQDGKHLIYKYFPFSNTNCKNVVPTIVGHWTYNDTTKWNNTSHSLDNFHNCTFNVFMTRLPPYTVIQANKLELKYIGGLEGELLKAMAQKLNFSVRLITDSKSNWNKDFGNISDPYALVNNSYVDILMGFILHSPEPLTYLTGSEVYYTTHLLAVIKKSSNVLTSRWVLIPFSSATWILIASAILLCIIMIVLFKPPSTKGELVITFLAMVMGNPIRLKHVSSRWCVMVFCISFMILRSIYQGKLYDSYRTMQYIKRPATLEELIMENYTIYADRFYLNTVPNITVAVRFPIYNMLEGNISDKVAILTNSAIFVNYINTYSKYGMYEHIRQPIYMQQLCAYFQKHSYLKKPFDTMILNMKSAGLIVKWSTSMKLENGAIVLPTTKEISFTRKPQKMTIRKFTWVFYIYFICLKLSLVVFILELVMDWYCRLKHKRLC